MNEDEKKQIAKKIIRVVNNVRVNKRRLSPAAKAEILLEFAKEFFSEESTPSTDEDTK